MKAPSPPADAGSAGAVQSSRGHARAGGVLECGGKRSAVDGRSCGGRVPSADSEGAFKITMESGVAGILVGRCGYGGDAHAPGRGNACVAAGAARVPSVVWTYDARPLRRLDLREPAHATRTWDTMHLLAALQGLVNRDAPRFYLFYCEEFGVDTDQFWFDWARTEDGWLRDTEVRTLASVDDALREFRGHYDGLVVYDPRVPATSNAASTAAGCEQLLPIRYDPSPDSLYRLLTERLALPVRLWLVNPDGSARFNGRGNLPDSSQPSSGSAKVDVHRWALERYLKSGRCGPGWRRITSTPIGCSARCRPAAICIRFRTTIISLPGAGSSSISPPGPMNRRSMIRGSRLAWIGRRCLRFCGRFRRFHALAARFHDSRPRRKT